MYQTMVVIRRLYEKKQMSNLLPLPIWLVSMFVLLYLVTRMIYWIVPIFLLSGLAIIPIAIITISRANKMRKQGETQEMVLFEERDGKLYWNETPMKAERDVEKQAIYITEDLPPKKPFEMRDTVIMFMPPKDVDDFLYFCRAHGIVVPDLVPFEWEE